MADSGVRMQAVLEGYGTSLKEKDLALPKQQPYLLRWVREFLLFAQGHGGPMVARAHCKGRKRCDYLVWNRADCRGQAHCPGPRVRAKERAAKRRGKRGRPGRHARRECLPGG